MKKQGAILPLCVMSILCPSTSSFGMMEEEFTHHSRKVPKVDGINYDNKLAVIHGKNLYSFSLSEELYNFKCLPI